MAFISSTSSQTSSLLGSQFTNEIPLTATLTSSSSIPSQNATASSSITVDKNFLVQLMAQVAQTNQSQKERIDGTGKIYVDSLRLSSGGNYTGYVDKDKMPCGTGKLIYPSNDEQKVYAYPKRGLDSRKSYEGEFEDGLPNGEGEITFISGATYKGKVVRGCMEGPGIFTSREGNVKYTGYFRNDFFHGQGQLVEVPEGLEKRRWTYKGAWENGLPHGFGESIDSFYIEGRLYTETTKGTWNHGEAPSCCTIGCPDCCSIQ